MKGAKIATKTNTSVMPMPTQTTTRGKRPASRHGRIHRSGSKRMRRRRPSVSDSRVDIGIHDIDEKADSNDEDGEESHDALDPRIVARSKVVHELTAETRP